MHSYATVIEFRGLAMVIVEVYITVGTVCQIGERLAHACVASFEVSTAIKAQFRLAGPGRQRMCGRRMGGATTESLNSVWGHHQVPGRWEPVSPRSWFARESRTGAARGGTHGLGGTRRSVWLLTKRAGFPRRRRFRASHRRTCRPRGSVLHRSRFGLRRTPPFA